MKLLGVFLMTISLSQCGSSKFDSNPPFNVNKATVTNWVDGVKGVRKTNVFVYVSNISSVEFNQMYYNNKIVKIERSENGERDLIIAGYYNKYLEDKISGLELHANAEKEFGNELPSSLQKFPFKLKKDEAVISYKKGSKTLYYKVRNITEIQKNN